MWYKYRPEDALPQETAEKIVAIPGVGLRGRVINVEANAAWLVEDILRSDSIEFEVDEPVEPEPIKSVHDLIPNGLQPWVPDFLTDYQRQGVINLSNKNGYFIWAAGCLAGDTVIAPTGLTIQELYLQRHAGEFPLYAQSVDDAAPKESFKNLIKDVVYSGRKELFEVKVTAQRRPNRPKFTRTIKATGDHKFLVKTPAGPTWMRLSDINLGAPVYVVDDQGQVVTGSISGARRLGVDHTYDICMLAPHHNFIANGFVVHNSGKSLGSICWAMVHPRRTLVVTRAPVRRSFAREIERFTTKRAFVVEGTTATDFTQLPEEFMFLVVSHQILPDHYKEILRWKPHNVIFDELHHLSSNKRWSPSQQADGKVKFSQLDNIASAAMEISRASYRRLGLSATPVRNLVKNLWAQLDLIEPMAWGPFYKEGQSSFTGRYCAARPGVYGGIDASGTANLDELWDRVSIVADQVSYATTHKGLPPKRRLVTFVPVADQVRATGFQKDFKAAAKGGATAMLEMKLMEAAARKRKYLKEVVDDALSAGQKVVVFTGRRQDCDSLGEELGVVARKYDAKIWVGHGGHSSAERDQMMRDYMAYDGASVLVGTGDAWGEGMNLQRTDLHLIAMLPYTPGQVIQWEGRTARLGQDRPVMIQYLIAEGTVDEHVSDILIRKLPAVENMVGDESVDGFSGQLMGADHEDEIMDSILNLMGGKDVGEDD